MRKLLLTVSIFSIIAGLIAGLILASNLNIQSLVYSSPKIPKESVDFLTKTGEAMASIVEAVKPAVVNISTVKTVRLRDPFFDDPFFRRFFGEPFGIPRERRQTGLGSGVIVDPSGYILTNNHVIRGADEIRVTLFDKREFKGKVIGTDPKTDLAVVKIDAKDLPYLEFGDSDKLKVGELVIAIGNPYGLNQTVTMGIVSATGRANVGIADYEDFIQTDAAINPGNSGGALVNVRGELVGINTAIFSTTGGYQGIGFAIPSNMAKTVMEQLIKHKKVVRGWLGVSIQALTPEMKKHFGLKEDRGVLINQIFENSPAEKAGLKEEDIILQYNGKDITDPTQLRNLVAGTPPGKEVELKIFREGKTLSIKVTIEELPQEVVAARGEYENVLRGVVVQNITPEIRKELQLPSRVTGVIVTDISEDSPAQGYLQKGDVIMAINRTRVNNIKDYQNIVSKLKDGDVLLFIYRDGQTFHLTLSME
ncbi:MAG: DegQ family serine endoprotease [Thermodesulfovibrionales bacterium]|nr:DegQ family serine endoprotease [Thermodesulfovibrionales bacterium]